MTAEAPFFIVVGLGNPGDEYVWTRHNIGSHAVKLLAEKYNLRLMSDKMLHAQVVKGTICGQTVLLSIPKLFVNESGKTVGRLIPLLNKNLKSLLVVVDDIETPFGEAKLAFAGGTRGHNGLKSIKNAIGSMEFMQLRLGVGRPNTSDVAGHVLGRFTQEEMGQMPLVMEKAMSLIEKWLEGEQ
jgi:peptidyl-tRNA hydrolase, PTH1 family